MLLALTAFFCAGLVSATLVLGVRDFWLRCPDLAGRDGRAGFHRWLIRGLGVPVAAWCGWHLLAVAGPIRGIAPLMPDLGGGAWANVLAGSAVVTLLAGVAWTACSLAWLVPDVARGIRRRDELRSLMWLVGVPTVLFAIGAAWGRSWILFSLIVTAGLWALLSFAARLVHQPSVSYARAVARLKFGKYVEAEQEIIRQLEEKEDDYDGWMMLAALYAEQFGQLGDARQTVHDLCAQESLTPYQISHAFTRLADWQLERGNDPAGARAALEEIIARCPDTPFARTAEHRRHLLPIDDAELRERRRPRTVRLPALNESTLVSASTDSAAVQLMDARTEAAQLADRLAQRPDDLVTHIRLVRVLAERLGRIDEAITRLRELRTRAGVTPTELAEWLALEATWELRLRKRESVARSLLEQLLREHPNSPQALAAQRQLQLLDDAEFTRAHPLAAPSPPPRIIIRIPEAPDPSAEAGPAS